MGYLAPVPQFDRQMKIAIIATYPQMSQLVLGLAKQMGLEVADYYASFEEAAKVAAGIEHEVDAILSRGGTAEYIKQAVNIPVITIPITPFDLAKIIWSLDDSIKEVAFSHFDRRLYGISEMEQRFGVRIHDYAFKNREDIQANLEDAASKGVTTVIGGNLIITMAQKLGLNGIEISAGAESVHEALSKTLQILFEKEKERKKATQLSIALDSISSGILIADEQNRVALCNKPAEKLLGVLCKPGTAVPLHFPGIPSEYLKRRLDTPEQTLLRTGDHTLSATFSPVFLNEHYKGIVATYEDITRIQSLEKLIRSQIQGKGFFAKNVFSDIITEDPKMKALKQEATLYAKSSSAVLLEGESGTGKEVFAQSIHNASLRADGPFVAINCAAIPPSLLESELFGYERGAFTGADKNGKQGYFEMAHMGTIFLDEIGEMPALLQARLLRVLQEREVVRVGGNKVYPIDVRIISATNRDLKQMCADGSFRMDLYYRLSVLNLKIPALRQRPMDVVPLSRFLMKKLDISLSEGVEKKLFDIFQRYSWPGNVRELQNVLERVKILSDIGMEGLSADQLQEMLHLTENTDTSERFAFDLDLSHGLKPFVRGVERTVIEKSLQENGNDLQRVAELLKIGRTTLWRKLYGPDF